MSLAELVEQLGPRATNIKHSIVVKCYIHTIGDTIRTFFIVTISEINSH